MIYGEEVNEDGILRDEIIEKCTQAVFKKVVEFICNNLKARKLKSDMELDGHSLLDGINEAIRVGDNLIMLRNGCTVCALVVDFDMPDLDTLLDAGIDAVWIDCTQIPKCRNYSSIRAQKVQHSPSLGLFDYVASCPHNQAVPFDF